MCHTSLLDNEQIDKCVENGMPKRIVKSLKFTIKKRLEQHEKKNENPQINNNNNKYIQDYHHHNHERNDDKYTTRNDEVQRNSFLECLDQIKTTTMSTTVKTETTTKTTRILINGMQATTTRQQFNEQEQHELIDATDGKNEEKEAQEAHESSNASLTGLCERFRLSNSSNVIQDFDNIEGLTNISGPKWNDNSTNDNRKTFLDAHHLTKCVQFFRKLVSHVYFIFEYLKNNKIYLFLTTTTQSAHVITVAIITFILLVVWPEFIGWKNIIKNNEISITTTINNNNNNNNNNNSNNNILLQTIETKTPPNKLFVIIYLGSFATHFGTQIWMTFVSGLSLYFSLPRHIFGQCQQILFPKYFSLNATLSILMLILFVKYFLITWTTTKFIQAFALALSGIIEIIVRLYLAPNLLQLMLQKYHIESSIGSGTEIGRLVQGDLIKCPYYQRIHGAFRRLHITVAIGNMITMAASCIHLYYLAAQLQITI